jgi:N-acetylmuramoyl-L-alanine amidase
MARLRHMIRMGAVFTALILCVSLPADAVPQSHGSSTPATSLRIDGVSYVEVRAYLARHGFKASWLERGKRMRFQSPKMTFELEHDNRDMVLNGLRALLGEPAVLRGNTFYVSRIDAEKLLLPIISPSSVIAPAAPALRVIVIDPGHGGKDTGTQNTSLKLDEKVFSLDVAKRLNALLAQQGYKVVMTRTDDRFIELAQRAEIANKAGADLFISIHFNAVGGASAVRGSETYFMTPQFQRSTGSAKSSPSDKELNPGNTNDPWNALLGYQMHASMLGKLGSADRGLKHARFAVLRLVKCPAVLVEAGYLSNTDEAKKIATPAYRQAMAEAFAQGVRDYARAIATTKSR